MFPIGLGGKPTFHDISPKFRDQVINAGFDLTYLLRCRIKVLMVTDGSSFIDQPGYNMTEVIKAITDDLPNYLDISVKTAEHHSGNAAGADLSNLNLASHNLDQYDQIWFIAVGSSFASGLDDDEVSAVWDFMQGGGGVFATGDHEDLGVALCGRIPRVRSMRRWYYPNPGPNGEPPAPSAGASGHSTQVNGSDFDGTPQTIVPKKYRSYHPFIYGARQYPHPVLCGPDGPIEVLPDHMHEGAIEVPPLDQTIPVGGVDVQEYPKRGANHFAPEVIATATDHNSGGSFGVIGAYDGHLVDEIDGGVGRIVVDATWHHFFNLNLNQFRSGYEAVEMALANGTTPNPADVTLANHYRPMRAYFQNIAVWLARKGNQRCIRRRGWWLIRWHLDVQMALLPAAELKRRGNHFEYFFDLGTKARDAFQRKAPQCESLAWILAATDQLEIAELLMPWDPRRDQLRRIEKVKHASLIDPEALQLAVLGGAMHAIGSELEKDLDEKSIDTSKFDKIVASGASQGLDSVMSSLEFDMKMFKDLRK